MKKGIFKTAVLISKLDSCVDLWSEFINNKLVFSVSLQDTRYGKKPIYCALKLLCTDVLQGAYLFLNFIASIIVGLLTIFFSIHVSSILSQENVSSNHPEVKFWVPMIHPN